MERFGPILINQGAKIATHPRKTWRTAFAKYLEIQMGGRELGAIAKLVAESKTQRQVNRQSPYGWAPHMGSGS